mmetsp:Transcript_14146/g.40089  ORF Transcript_14146/g.40089 Transcript_14146/m.40089 type:complete len:203 (-) Transcript_14146:884-1492(-)
MLGSSGPSMKKSSLENDTSSRGALNITRMVANWLLVTSPASPDCAMKTPRRRPCGWWCTTRQCSISGKASPGSVIGDTAPAWRVTQRLVEELLHGSVGARIRATKSEHMAPRMSRLVTSRMVMSTSDEARNANAGTLSTGRLNWKGSSTHTALSPENEASHSGTDSVTVRVSSSKKVTASGRSVEARSSEQKLRSWTSSDTS